MCMSMHMYKIMYVSIYRLYIFCMPFLVPRCAKMYIVYIYTICFCLCTMYLCILYYNLYNFV